MKQYNEQDVLKAIAGSYQPGFLQIKLTNSFDGGLGRFSQKELGTFCMNTFTFCKTYLLHGDCI